MEYPNGITFFWRWCLFNSVCRASFRYHFLLAFLFCKTTYLVLKGSSILLGQINCIIKVFYTVSSILNSFLIYWLLPRYFSLFNQSGYWSRTPGHCKRPHVHFPLKKADLDLHLSTLLLVLNSIVALSSNIIKIRPKTAGRSQRC